MVVILPKDFPPLMVHALIRVVWTTTAVGHRRLNLMERTIIYVPVNLDVVLDVTIMQDGHVREPQQQQDAEAATGGLVIRQLKDWFFLPPNLGEL